MKALNTSLALAVSALCLAASPAHAVDLVTEGALGVPANRVVGAWTTEAAVRPCGSNLPLSPARNIILYHAGGTVLAMPRMAPAAGFPNVAGIPGLHQRGPDMGTWSYNPRTHQYRTKLRFEWHVDGLYHGYSTVDRTFLLSNDGKQASGPVRVTRYTADGAVVGAVCGEAVSTRI